MSLKNKDFVEIDYIAIDKESNKIFDLTMEEEAKKSNVYNPKARYGPVIICIGENQVLKGVDESLVNKEPKQEYTVEIPPEKGFGRKNPKLLKLMPIKIFKKQNIRPFPGLQVNLDSTIGTIRTVSGGRVIVDFNHPLAGHTLIYKIKINKIISDDKKRVESILSFFIENPKVSIKDNIAEIESDIPEHIQKVFTEKIKETIPKIKEVKYKQSLKNK